MKIPDPVHENTQKPASRPAASPAASPAESNGATGARLSGPVLSALFMLCATAFIAASMMSAKALGVGVGSGVDGQGLHPLQVSAGRFSFGLLGIALAALMLRPKFTKPTWPLHLGRSTVGWAGVTLMFAAVAQIPMTDATAISFLNPVFGMILVMIFLGEVIGPIRWACAVLAFVGALILLQPGSSAFQPAALLALGAAMLFGVETTFLKHLSGKEPAMQVIGCNNLISTPIALTAASFFWIWPTPTQWLLMAGTGLFMVTAQGFFTNSFKRGDASFALPFSYATLVFVTLYDLLIFKVWPAAPSWLGAGIILISGLLLAWRESVRAKRAAA